MSGTSEFYLACAAQSLRDADAATLNNVRDRCLRSAASWQAMAERAADMEANRRGREKPVLEPVPSSDPELVSDIAG